MRGRCKRGLSVAAGEMFGRKKGRCEETHEYVPFLFTVSLSRWLLSVACLGDQSPGQTARVSHMPGEALLFLQWPGGLSVLVAWRV